MSIVYNYLTGYPNHVISDLKHSISQYANNSSYIKVGITNNPENRWYQHKNEDPDWEKMVVVYKSSSIDNVREIERELINHTIEREESYNFIGGGGGNFGDGPQFLYFLIQR